MTRNLAIVLLISTLVAATPAAAAFPLQGRSLGGVVRAAPGMESRRIGSLRENEPILIVKKTDVEMNGYAWFEIRWRGRTGYQWGGIMCADTALEGIYQACR
jgi:hypothetical protein